MNETKGRSSHVPFSIRNSVFMHSITTDGSQTFHLLSQCLTPTNISKTLETVSPTRSKPSVTSADALEPLIVFLKLHIDILTYFVP